MTILAGILTAGIGLSGLAKLALMIPLCLSVAVVYKTTRCERVSDIPLASLLLWGTIVVGMYGVGVAVWALFLMMR